MKKGKVASEKYNELTLQKRELTPSIPSKEKELLLQTRNFWQHVSS
jgi:hypothetical protein